METNKAYVKVTKIADYTLRVTLTKQLEELGIKEGDIVYCYVKDNKIIIERSI